MCFRNHSAKTYEWSQAQTRVGNREFHGTMNSMACLVQLKISIALGLTLSYRNQMKQKDLSTRSLKQTKTLGRRGWCLLHAVYCKSNQVKKLGFYTIEN